MAALLGTGALVGHCDLWLSLSCQVDMAPILTAAIFNLILVIFPGDRLPSGSFQLAIVLLAAQEVLSGHSRPPWAWLE